MPPPAKRRVSAKSLGTNWRYGTNGAAFSAPSFVSGYASTKSAKRSLGCAHDSRAMPAIAPSVLVGVVPPPGVAALKKRERQSLLAEVPAYVMSSAPLLSVGCASASRCWQTCPHR